MSPDPKPISLILLPGLDGTGLLFQPLLAALPATIKPVIVSYPGDRHLSYDDLLPYAQAALPKDDPFILLGESFSGPLATMLAAQRPKNLLGLILCATFITRPWPLVRPVIPLVARGPIFNLYIPYKRIRALLGRYSTAQRRTQFEQMRALVKPHVFASRVRLVFQVDATEALRSCDCPMLYLKAKNDYVVPARNLRIIQKIKPDIQVATIDSNHMILQRHAVEAAAAISAFISSIDQSHSHSHQG